MGKTNEQIVGEMILELAKRERDLLIRFNMCTKEYRVIIPRTGDPGSVASRMRVFSADRLAEGLADQLPEMLLEVS